MKNTQSSLQELKRLFLLIVLFSISAVTMMESHPLVSIICIVFILLLALKGLVSVKRD